MWHSDDDIDADDKGADDMWHSYDDIDADNIEMMIILLLHVVFS